MGKRKAEAQMRIGFDISQTGNSKAGCGWFAASLIRTLANSDNTNEYTLYPTFGDSYWDDDWATATVRIERERVLVGSGQCSLEEMKKFWTRPARELEDSLGQPDIIHSNNYFCPHGFNRAKLVYTLYDLSFVEWPDLTTEANRIVCFDGVFRASLYADLVLSISEYTRQHFLEVFPHFPKQKVRVVRPGSRFSENSPVCAPDSCNHLNPFGFWLNVGTVEPRKNQKKLLAAYSEYCGQTNDTRPLVIAGGKGWITGGLGSEIDRLGLDGRVKLLGYIKDEELAWLYKNCFAMIYPSLFEGFGLPVLEAMGFGAVVITSNTSSLPEVVGSAGLLVDPNDSGQIAAAMESLLRKDIDMARLRSNSRLQAEKFSWRKAAESVLDCYIELATKEKR
jgi:glycosyltransferase involved in cell wall biosynthesis